GNAIGFLGFQREIEVFGRNRGIGVAQRGLAFNTHNNAVEEPIVADIDAALNAIGVERYGIDAIVEVDAVAVIADLAAGINAAKAFSGESRGGDQERRRSDGRKNN